MKTFSSLEAKLILIGFYKILPNAWKIKDYNLQVHVFKNIEEIHIVHKDINYNTRYNENTGYTAIAKILDK